MSSSVYSEYIGPSEVVAAIQRGEYSSQGHTHIDNFCRCLRRDLLIAEPELTTPAKNGEIVAERNHSPGAQPFQRDIVLAIGSPAEGGQRELAQDTIPTGDVDDVWLGFNTESLMSDAIKNSKNRGTDIHSFYLGVYQSTSLAATGCIVLLNVADIDGDPKNIINKFNEFSLSDGSLGQKLDALCILPIEYDEEAPEETNIAPEYVPESSKLHYDGFVETLASALKRRFEGEYKVTKESVESVLSQEESDVLEFKRAMPEDAKDIRKELAAFANHEGGTLILGVDDENGEVVGLQDAPETEERVANLAGPLPSATIDAIERATVDGEELLIVNVNRATEVPIEYEDRFPIRSGTTTTYLSGREIVNQFPREKYSTDD